MPSPGVKVAVAGFLNRDLGKVSDRCDHREMKLNASKTKTIGETVLEESDDLDILSDILF